MTCPRCKNGLIDIQSQGSTLHFCGQCRGVWFDSNELLYHLRAKSGESELKWTESASRNTHMSCPHCGSGLKETPFNVCLSSGCASDPFLLVDYCAKCNGVWMDEGELQKAESLGRDLPKITKKIFDPLNGIKTDYPSKLRKNGIPFAAPVAAFVILFSFLLLYSKVALQSHEGPAAENRPAICRACNGAGRHARACGHCRGLGKISVASATTLPCTRCGGLGHVSSPSSRCYKCSGNGWITDSSAPCARCKGNGYLADSVKRSCGSCYGSGHIQVRETCGICNGSRKSSINSALGCPGCNGSGFTTVKKTCPDCLSGVIETRKDSPCPECRGRGRDTSRHVCDQCMGTGTLEASRGASVCQSCAGSGYTPLTGPNTVICPDCSGSGLGAAAACRSCEGKGVVRES